MKVLVYPHELKVGGSAINAIDLAAAVRDRGHEVVVFGTPGPLAEHVAGRGLPLIVADVPLRPRPSPWVMRELRHAVKRERPDLVHVYEHHPLVEAFFGVHLPWGMPVVSTVLSMWVLPYLPESPPMIVGTRELLETTRRRGPVHLVEPPVDTDEDHPSVDGSAFRAEWGLDDGIPAVVVVSRFTKSLKLEGLERAIGAAAVLADEMPLRLVLVGSGPCYDHLSAMAGEVNRRAGQQVVVLTGQMLDPRPAYAGADVVLGMGGSVLRGMAFEKAAIVVGEGGYSEIVEPRSIGRFLQEGFYALGDGDLSPEPLALQIKELLKDRERARHLGRFARRVVVERFGLPQLAARLEAIYQDACDAPVRRVTLVPEAVRTAGRLLVLGKARPKLARLGRRRGRS